MDSSADGSSSISHLSGPSSFVSPFSVLRCCNRNNLGGTACSFVHFPPSSFSSSKCPAMIHCCTAAVIYYVFISMKLNWSENVNAGFKKARFSPGPFSPGNLLVLDQQET